MRLSPLTTVAVIIDDPQGRSIIDRYLPGLVDSPYIDTVRRVPIGALLENPQTGLDEATRAALEADLDGVAHLGPSIVESARNVFVPDPDYESDEVPYGSAVARIPNVVARWDVCEIEVRGPAHGNPFVDVELTATFVNEGNAVRVGGFYDGDGTYRIRFAPPREGRWLVETESSARSLHGITGSFECGPPRSHEHGPVRVADRFHFAHEDGTRFLPFGTTAYAWTHQSATLRTQTLDTLTESPFTKLRMCVFPKFFAYNEDEPELRPFEGSPESGWDTTRFVPEFFRRLEDGVRELAHRGIQADVVLFHPYDRWGFAALGAASDDRYVSYLVRRLAAFSNVWWSLANEYDLLARPESDWDRIAAVVAANDPASHLISIHNFQPFFDYDREWVTHVSIQRTDVYRTTENTTQWRERWGKPVVVDEFGYEGDLDMAWGNLTGEEVVRRSWEAALRGGYATHGETYLNDRDELWWSKGGVLVGSSPERIRFLLDFIHASPTEALEPVALGGTSYDTPWAGVPGEYYVGYFGLMQPSFTIVDLPAGATFSLEIIDTWAMTVHRVEGEFSGTARLPLPARAYTAARLVRVPESAA